MNTRSVAFYFDVGSPYSWLAAERIDELLPVAVAWTPILLGGVFAATGRSSWSLTDARVDGIAEVERRAAAYGLPPVRWPEPWPSDGLAAMRAATWAESEGRGREFALAAFRMAFTEGRLMSRMDNVLAAAEAVGLHPGETEAALGSTEVKDHLRTVTRAAIERGVLGVPTVAVGEHRYWGDDQLEAAAAAAGAA